MKTTYDRPFLKNVHDIISYIELNSYKIDLVTYCPYCSCPEFSGNLEFGGKAFCKTCHEWINKDRLLKIDPLNYLTIISHLPLRNGGYTWESGKDLYLAHSRSDSPTRCYVDLEQDELLKFDSCSV